MNKGQKHKSKNTKSTKKHKKTKTLQKTRKSKKQKPNQASSITKTRRRKKGKRETDRGGEWCPVVSGALCMGVRSAQFESYMKPGVRFMELGAGPKHVVYSLINTTLDI